MVKGAVRKQSRLKNKAKSEPETRPRVGANTNEPVPTVVFHGVKQKCSEDLLVNLVQKIKDGTKGYVECVEIGDGPVTSIFTTLNS